MVECAAMSRPRVLIDGHAGTTGLRIRSWLTERDDLDLFTLDEVSRKSTVARRQAIAESDIALLCLPDDAATEAAGWAKESGSRVIDASSSHRVADGWVYGLPELVSEQRAAIRGAQYVTNPGCYPSAFILLMRPLHDAGLLAPDAPISCHLFSTCMKLLMQQSGFSSMCLKCSVMQVCSKRLNFCQQSDHFLTGCGFRFRSMLLLWLPASPERLSGKPCLTGIAVRFL